MPKNFKSVKSTKSCLEMNYGFLFLLFPPYHQMTIEQLEHERNVMADVIAQKMREHQQLLQVKMDLGMEVATYR